MKIDVNVVRRFLPKNDKEADDLWNNKLSQLMYDAYEYQDSEAENLFEEAPRWKDYIDCYDDDYKEASKIYRKDKKEFYEKDFKPYQSIWNSDIWKEACHYLVALKLFKQGNRTLKCEHCNEIIFEKEGFCYCIVHHKDYEGDIFDDESIIIVHPDCHKKIHGTFEESTCKLCGKGTNSSWKKFCLECYKKR